MRYLRIYDGDDGRTRFGEGEIDLAATAFAPPAPPLDASEPVPAARMLFIRLPAGWSDPAHPSPARQWMFAMSGRATVTAGTETRQVHQGDVLLVEDTAGAGHGTAVAEDMVMAVVQL